MPKITPTESERLSAPIETAEELARNSTAHPTPVSHEKLITLKAAGEILGIPYYKMRKAAKLGLFPVYRFGNSRMLVRLSEVVAAIDRSRDGGKS